MYLAHVPPHVRGTEQPPPPPKKKNVILPEQTYVSLSWSYNELIVTAELDETQTCLVLVKNELEPSRLNIPQSNRAITTTCEI